MLCSVRIKNELCNFWFSYDTSSLGKNISNRTRHGKSWISLIVYPNSWRSKLGIGLRRCYCLLPLNSLDDQSLSMSVIDLSIVLIKYPISFFRYVWFVILSALHYNNWISKVRSSSFLIFLVLLIESFAYDDGSRISTVTKYNRVLLKVDTYNCTSTQTTIKICLLFELLLSLQECCDHCLLDLLINLLKLWKFFFILRFIWCQFLGCFRSFKSLLFHVE